MQSELRQSLLHSEKTRQTQSTWAIFERASRNLNNRFSEILEKDTIQQLPNRKSALVSEVYEDIDTLSRSDSFSTIRLMDDDEFSIQNGEPDEIGRSRDMMTEENSSQYIRTSVEIVPHPVRLSARISNLKSLKIEKPIILNPNKPRKSNKPLNLNDSIFNLKPQIRSVLYFSNFLFNTLIRAMFVVILISMILDNKKYRFVQITLIMEGVCLFLYGIAIGKLLQNRQDRISIHFQKFFFEKSLSDLDMDRTFRKEFTLGKVKRNVFRFLNPRTQFKMDTQISLMRQEIFKRIEITLCIIPFTIFFLLYPQEFQCDGWNSKVVVASILTIEAIRTTLHYLVIYVFS